MNVLLNFVKSTILATLIFWTIVFTDQFEAHMLLIALVSTIAVFACCAVTIALTICPFLWRFETESFNKKSIFKTFFPYYSTTCFGLCLYGVFINNFDIYSIAFFTASFITTSQSWIWFTKDATT